MPTIIIISTRKQWFNRFAVKELKLSEIETKREISKEEPRESVDEISKEVKIYKEVYILF